MGIRCQVNLKMLGFGSPIPSPRGRGLGRGQASRTLASLAKDTNLLSERDSVFEKAVVPRGQGIHYEVLYVFDCDYCCCFIYCYSSRFVGNTINIFC